MAVELTFYDFLRGPHYRCGNLRLQQTQAFIHLCRCLLDLPKCAHKLARKAQIADRKIEYGAVGAGAVIGICRYSHLTHRITLDARFLCTAHFFTPR